MWVEVSTTSWASPPQSCQVGEAAARAAVQVELERARVQGGTLEVGREVVLAQAEVAVGAADRQRVRVLRGARLVDHVGDLEGLLDDDAVGDVEEGAAAPERRGGGLELVAVVGQARHEVLGHELGVIADRVLQRGEDHAALRQLGVELDVHHAGPALHEQAGELLALQGVGDDLRNLAAARGGGAPGRRSRGRAATSSRTPSAATTAARGSRRPRAPRRAAPRASGRWRPPRLRPAAGRAWPGGPRPAWSIGPRPQATSASSRSQS